jgi:hypothetical protein
MLLVIQTDDMSKTSMVDLAPSEPIDVLMQMVAMELGVPPNQQELVYDGKTITSMTGDLQSIGLVDGGVITGMSLYAFVWR